VDGGCSRQGDSRVATGWRFNQACPLSTRAMNREQHLTRTDQFATVYNQGRSWANQLLVMKTFPNGLELSRFGFSINKRVGKAVVRNRVRRRLRECVQSMPWKQGWDVVLIVRSTASNADYAEIRKALEQLNRRARMRDAA